MGFGHTIIIGYSSAAAWSSFCVFLSNYLTRILRVRLGLRFSKSAILIHDFKIFDLKKVIFKNAVKRLAKSQFSI